MRKNYIVLGIFLLWLYLVFQNFMPFQIWNTVEYPKITLVITVSLWVIMWIVAKVA
jgi:hypothetical protein